MRCFLLCLFCSTFLFACVSKKKHQEVIAVADRQADSLQYKIDRSHQKIDSLRIRLAEEYGANRALLATQDKLQDRIISLDDEIEELELLAANRAENLGGRIEEKEQLISALENRLQTLNSTLASRDEELERIESLLIDTLKLFDSTQIDFIYKQGALVLALQSDFLFTSGSTTRLKKSGETAIEYISKVLIGFPSMEITIVGHTDNTALLRNSINNKWEFSSLRASTLAYIMTRRYELSTSLITASGKGEYAPRASNTTEEGRKKNERIELVIQASQQRLIRDLKRILERP